MMDAEKIRSALSYVPSNDMETSKERKKRQNREWNKAHPEKMREAKIAYRNTAKGKEKTREYARQTRLKLPDKVKEASRKYYMANIDKAKARTAQWKKDNPDRNTLNEHNRRAKKRENGGLLSKDLQARLFKLQKGKCACCGKPLGDDYQLDHIMPIARGGANVDQNIQLLRRQCNSHKRAKHPVDFMQSRGFLL